MRKGIFGLIAAVFMGAGVLTGCTGLNVGTINFTASDYLISYGAYSTASLLSTLSNTSGNALYGGGVSGNLLLGEPTEVMGEQLDLFNSYYNMLSGYLEKQTDEIVSFTELDNTGSGYEHVLEVRMDVSSDQMQVMTLKYNVGQDIEEEIDDEYDEEEQESKFQGELVLGEKTYNFIGLSETEDGERKFRIKAIIDELNYVKMQLKEENNEVKYQYELCEDGVINSTEIKIENDEDEEFKIDLKTINNNIISEYTLKQQLENGITVHKVHYNIDGEEGVFYVTKSVNELGEEIVTYTIKTNHGEEMSTQKHVENEYGHKEHKGND